MGQNFDVSCSLLMYNQVVEDSSCRFMFQYQFYCKARSVVISGVICNILLTFIIENVFIDKFSCGFQALETWKLAFSSGQ